MNGRLSYPAIIQAMKELVTKPNYPCVPAVRSFERGEYMVELCESFGSGNSASKIAHALTMFRERQKRNGEPFLSFWAVWEDEGSLTEEEHEKRFWEELSHVAALSDKPWDPLFSPDPSNKRFCFSFDGEAYFVVGLHKDSARMARQFPFPAIVFNLYSQFEDLATKGAYDAIVKTNRKREMAFQGNLNPMVEKHSEDWEAIQFSGRMNAETWQNPFRHMGAGPHD